LILGYHTVREQNVADDRNLLMEKRERLSLEVSSSAVERRWMPKKPFPHLSLLHRRAGWDNVGPLAEAPGDDPIGAASSMLDD
jgi:hypothetical protein